MVGSPGNGNAWAEITSFDILHINPLVCTQVTVDIVLDVITSVMRDIPN